MHISVEAKKDRRQKTGEQLYEIQVFHLYMFSCDNYLGCIGPLVLTTSLLWRLVFKFNPGIIKRSGAK